MSNWFLLVQQTYHLHHCLNKGHINALFFCKRIKPVSMSLWKSHWGEVRAAAGVFLSVSFSLSLSLYDSLNLEFVSCSLIDFYCLLDIKTIIIWGFYCVLSHLWIHLQLLNNCRLSRALYGALWRCAATDNQLRQRCSLLVYLYWLFLNK